ncbi:MAG: hypothetical protein IIB88_06365, partial [Chloroflexi bacterium]|nr:hypothetical protein [Chloroflexota bacterium]
WAELPIVSTTGDVLADRIANDPLGVAVTPGDSSAMAKAILRLVEDQEFYAECVSNMAPMKEELRWERVLQPLIEFCRSDEEWAVPKRQRIVPLLRRTLAYLIEKSLVPIARW